MWLAWFVLLEALLSSDTLVGVEVASSSVARLGLGAFSLTGDCVIDTAIGESLGAAGISSVTTDSNRSATVQEVPESSSGQKNPLPQTSVSFNTFPSSETPSKHEQPIKSSPQKLYLHLQYLS